MTLALSEFLQSLAVTVFAYVVLTLLTLLFKAESAAGRRPEASPKP